MILLMDVLHDQLCMTSSIILALDYFTFKSCMNIASVLKQTILTAVNLQNSKDMPCPWAQPLTMLTGASLGISRRV